MKDLARTFATLGRAVRVKKWKRTIPLELDGRLMFNPVCDDGLLLPSVPPVRAEWTETALLLYFDVESDQTVTVVGGNVVLGQDVRQHTNLPRATFGKGDRYQLCLTLTRLWYE